MTSTSLQPPASTATPFLSVKSDLTLKIDGVPYLLIDRAADSSLELHPSHEGPTPFIVFPVCDDEKITASCLAAFRSLHLDTDDIFQPIFLKNIIFYGDKGASIDMQPSAVSLLASWNTTNWQFVKAADKKNDIAPGPYISHQGRVWEPWRIYTDDTLSMMVSFKPESQVGSNSTLVKLDNTLDANQVRIVVPSRSYSSSIKIPGKPLLGTRIAVKDIFDIKGFKTTLCSRAWTEYHEQKSETAAFVQSLIDLGAIIVGKTRLNAMVVREEPMECVEFLAPFNPRGDGYQTPAGSSTGSCVVLAAYPWLDFALGSDTNGSCRKPAYWTGVFAIRPTTGVLNTSGVASFCPTCSLAHLPRNFFDVSTFFGRDISRFKDFANLWYGDSQKLVTSKLVSTVSTKILYPTDYLPTTNKDQMKLIDSFVQDLEGVLSVKRTEISLAEMWRNNGPNSTGGTELSDYLATAGTLPYYKDAVGLLKGYTDGYKERFGKAPFFHQALRWRIDQAEKVTPGERDEGWERIYTYKEWLLKNVFSEATVLILPIDEGNPSNREKVPPPFGLLSGYHPLYMSPIAGTPEVTLPIGEISYYSSVTQRDEPLPISVSIVSPPGTDLDLIELVHKVLVMGKKPVKVVTGRSIFKD